MEPATEILSSITIFNKYSRYLKDKKRRETWEELVNRNKQMHLKKFPSLQFEIESNYKLVLEKKVLPSMRSLQFANLAMAVNPARGYNCSAHHIDSVESFSETMWLLLTGVGVGYSVQKHHIEKLPPIHRPLSPERRYLIQDSIEGWADAVKALMKSYLKPNSNKVRFDFSSIREKGAELVTSGGKAPGPDPLRLCLEEITKILNTVPEGEQLSTIQVHDIICLIADAVLAGGIRRAALISLFSLSDNDLLTCKSNFKILSTAPIYIEGPVDIAGEKVFVEAVHTDQQGKTYRDLQVTYQDPAYGILEKKLYWVSDSDIDNYLNIDQTLPWYYFHPHRGRANNSVVLVRHKMKKRAEFDKLWKTIEESKCGEPGLFWTNDSEALTNPCSEINLNHQQFCNLTEVNVSDCTTQDELNRRVKAATFIGTLQASYTDFHYLRPGWKKQTEKEALLGVSMTGIGSGTVLELDLSEATSIAVEENKRVADLIGIKSAARVTCVKPSGTTSCVMGTSSGIHAWHAPFYLRRIRVGKSEQLYKYLNMFHPELLEDDQLRSDLACIVIPQKAPATGIFRDEPALQLLERVKRFHQEWILPGHRKGVNTHNVSVTVSVKDNEWEEVGNWLWNNKESYCGISVLPFDTGTYIQSPFEEITEEEYNRRVKTLYEVDLSLMIEEENNTNLTGELACSGSAGCTVV